MVLTTHALAGAVIGKNISNIWMVIFLSLAVHYALDSIRHGEYVGTMEDKYAVKDNWWKIALDFGFGMFVIGLMLCFLNFDQINVRNIFWGIFFSMLPDSLTLIYWKTRWKFFRTIYKFHHWCHRLPRIAPERRWDFRNEIYEIMVFLSLAVIFLFI